VRFTLSVNGRGAVIPARLLRHPWRRSTDRRSTSIGTMVNVGMPFFRVAVADDGALLIRPGGPARLLDGNLQLNAEDVARAMFASSRSPRSISTGGGLAIELLNGELILVWLDRGAAEAFLHELADHGGNADFSPWEWRYDLGKVKVVPANR